jgi:hypothetical protein
VEEKGPDESGDCHCGLAIIASCSPVLWEARTPLPALKAIFNSILLELLFGAPFVTDEV